MSDIRSSDIKSFDNNNVFSYVDEEINDKYNMKDGSNYLELIGGKNYIWNSPSENKPSNYDTYPKLLPTVGSSKIYPKQKLANAAIIPGKNFSDIIPPTINIEKHIISSYKNLNKLGSFKNTIKMTFNKILNITWEKNDKSILYYIVSFTSSIGQQNIKTKETYINISGLQTGLYTFGIFAINDISHSPMELFEVNIK
jgi:hypothetical protein